MPRKRFNAERIVAKLRRVAMHAAAAKALVLAYKEAGLRSPALICDANRPNASFLELWGKRVQWTDSRVTKLEVRLVH